MEKINERRAFAEKLGDSLEETNNAMAVLEEANVYMSRVKDSYTDINETLVAATAAYVDGELTNKRREHARLVEEDRVEKEKADAAEDKRLARMKEGEETAKRNSEYTALQEALKVILRCKSDIPDKELEEARGYIGEMRTKIPEQFAKDTAGIVTAFTGCIKRYIGYANPQRARDVQSTVLTFLPEAQDLAVLKIEDKDPCDARGLEGLGSKNRECFDPLSRGGTGPQLVVIPPENALTGEKYAISKTEIKVGDYNAYCEKAGCEELPGSVSIPATNLTRVQAEGYMVWLSDQSGKKYRFPTVAEWSHAARANDDTLDDNVNCTVDSRGVKLGEKLKNSLSGRPNGWGLYNHVGNAREWATEEDGSLLAMGGAHTDPKAECTLQKRVAHAGVPDPVTGFRVVRKIPPKSS